MSAFGPPGPCLRVAGGEGDANAIPPGQAGFGPAPPPGKGAAPRGAGGRRGRWRLHGVRPLFPDKHGRRSGTTADTFLSWSRDHLGWDPGPVPAGAIFTSSAYVTAYLGSQGERFSPSRTLTMANGTIFVPTGRDGSPVAIACLGPGPTAVAIGLENLFALGVRRFAVIGSAPAISGTVMPTDCVVIDRALRDDGVSPHYLPPGRWSFPRSSCWRRRSRPCGPRGRSHERRRTAT